MIANISMAPQMDEDVAIESVVDVLSNHFGLTYGINVRSDDEQTQIETKPHLFHMIGVDSTGILDVVMSHLSGCDVSVASINAATGPAPFSGEKFFEMESLIEIPVEQMDNVAQNIETIQSTFATECSLSSYTINE
jgi:glycine cleavage system regulatory protein